MNEKMSKKEFWKKGLPAKTRGEIVTGAVFAYISAAITAVVAVLFLPLSLIDAALTLGLGLGLHLARSRVCGIVLSVYFIWSKIVMVANGSAKSIGWMGIVMIVAFVTATVGAFQYQKLWKQYQNDEYTPECELQAQAAAAAQPLPTQVPEEQSAE